MPKLVSPVVARGAMAKAHQPTLDVTEGIVLRPWHDDDAPDAVRAFQDPDIRRWHARELVDIAEAKLWIATGTSAWNDETSANWAVAERKSGVVLGRVSMYTELAEGLGEVAYWVLPEARGRGLATLGTMAATSWAHQLGIQRVRLEHSVHNEGSRRVARSAGFQAEGIARRSTKHQDGWHDMQIHHTLLETARVRRPQSNNVLMAC